MSLSSSAATANQHAVRPVTILHTSDWHLGRRLYGYQRYAEFETFLNWLYHTIISEQVDVLVVAGDIFDTMTPSNRAQGLYYDFLTRMLNTPCQHVVIVAGNHDSPTFLDATKGLLQALNVQVVGTASANPSDEVLLLSSIDNHLPLCLIAAVPYLRDRDVRSSHAGESGRDKDANVIAGIEAHYRAVTDHALAQQAQLLATYGQQVPIIATGHLFTTNACTTDDDGVRDLYVGSLGSVSASIFDAALDYVALGHLHVPQKVGGLAHIRYSGSPIPMGFGEAKQQKQVLLVRFGAPFSTDTDTNNTDFYDAIKSMRIRSFAVPCFQKLVQISGDWQRIASELNDLVSSAQRILVEVTYTDNDIITNLRERIQGIISGSQIIVLKTSNRQFTTQVLRQTDRQETLQDLSHNEVFERCLSAHKVMDEHKPALRTAYRQLVQMIQQADNQAE